MHWEFLLRKPVSKVQYLPCVSNTNWKNRLARLVLQNASLTTPANHFFRLHVEISSKLLRRSSTILNKILVLHINGIASYCSTKQMCSSKPETRKICGVTPLCRSFCASWNTILAFSSSQLTKWATLTKLLNRGSTSPFTIRL